MQQGTETTLGDTVMCPSPVSFLQMQLVKATCRPVQVKIIPISQKWKLRPREIELTKAVVATGKVCFSSRGFSSYKTRSIRYDIVFVLQEERQLVSILFKTRLVIMKCQVDRNVSARGSAGGSSAG